MKDNINYNNSELENLTDNKPHKLKNDNNEAQTLIKEKQTDKKIKIYPKKYNYICRKKGNTYMIIVDQKNNPVLRIFIFIYLLL